MSWQVPGWPQECTARVPGSQGSRGGGAGGSWQPPLTKGCHLPFPSFTVAFHSLLFLTDSLSESQKARSRELSFFLFPSPLTSSVL